MMKFMFLCLLCKHYQLSYLPDPLMEVSMCLAFYGLCLYYSVDQEFLIAENYFIVDITFTSPFLS